MTARARWSRRAVLRSGLALAGVPWAALAAEDEAYAQALRAFAGAATPQESKVTLTIEPLVDNGNSVPVSIKVESPMSAADHVTAIALFTQRNPQPEVAVFALSPANGRAEVATRIRLAGTQRVSALARTSTGAVHVRTLEVIVTTAACAEDT